MPGVDLSHLDFVPPDHFGRSASIVFAAFAVLVGLAILTALWRAQTLAALQKHDHDFLVASTRALFPGPRRVVHGVVDGREAGGREAGGGMVDGDDVSVRIEIEQAVENRTNRNETWHVWQETGRTVTAEPFYLTTDAGEVVHVQPSDDTVIVDALETRYPTDRPAQRVRVAEVRRGERLHAYGELIRGAHPGGGGYRGGGEGLVLRRPRGERLLLATDAVEQRYTARIRFLRFWGGVALAAWVLVAGFANATFVTGAVFGRHELATFTRASRSQTPSKHGPVTHLQLFARTDDGDDVGHDVPRATFDAVTEAARESPRVRLPVRVVHGAAWASALGYTATSQETAIVSTFSLAFVGLLVSALFLRPNYRQTVAWYDRRRVSDRGPNHWVETRPHRPISPLTD